MVAVCVLSDMVSWFSCAEQGLPFTEVLTVSIFFIFFMVFKSYPTREALPASLFISTIVALSFLGLNLINPVIPIAGVILTAASAVLLNNQNTTT